MSYFNAKLLRKIPKHLEGVMEYYPDVVLFELNQVQYIHLWKKLSFAKYIYTNGYEIRPTNWFMYAYQSVKGWLGFSNNCHPQKVSYTLDKLAYYGYTKQFNQPDFPALKNFSMSSKICALVINNRNDATTAQLQTELLTGYYNAEHCFNFNYPYECLPWSHRFGESWKSVGAWEELLLLDPQDDSLIAETINFFDNEPATKVRFLLNSKYARAAAQYYCDKAKNVVVPPFLLRIFWIDPRPGFLAKSLIYDPEIAKRNVENFIQHHIQQKEYQHAFNLLGVLISNNPKLVLKFLLEIPEEERNKLIDKDSLIAAIMANYYIEKKQYKIARQFYANIEELNPVAAFTLEFKENNYVRAYEIFKKHAASQLFSAVDRQALAEILSGSAETAYDTGKSHRDKKQWKDAKHHYLQSLELKKAAHHLHPCEKYQEDLHIHKRLYAGVLIDADIDLYQPEESNIASIHKAILLLKESYSDDEQEQNYQKHTLAKGLMRQVDTLREKIAMTYFHHSFVKEHKLKHKQELSVFIKILNELIAFLEGTTDKNLRLKLGKAHYLLADVQHFFDISVSDINHHYKKAMEAVPDNPFYVLRVSEIFEEDKEKNQEIGVIKLKEMGYTVYDFTHWHEERWVKRDKMIYGIKDIHELPIGSPKSSGFSFS